MDSPKMNARRVVGGMALLGALGLLIAGETFLKPRLGGVVYVLYWLLCLLLTSVAIIAAFLDVRALQRRVREEQKTLLESTFKDLPRKK